MKLPVSYIDRNGDHYDEEIKMSMLAFIKHAAIAGQRYAPLPSKLFRTIGMLFSHCNYLERNAFNSGRFSEPPIAISDPTEKAQFSNLAGKAIADFLSKKINQSLFTVNYEAAMRLQGHPLKGKRPDLIAYTRNATFAIEAKGKDTGSPGSMTAHKAQSAAGPIPVNFSVASVSYNLYNEVKCNYHDPILSEIEYDEVSLAQLSRNYYRGLSEFLNGNVFEVEEAEFQGESFYKIGLSGRYMRNFYGIYLLQFLRPKLILPRAIRAYAETGLSRNTEPFLLKDSEDETLYIDNDRVGLMTDIRFDDLGI